MFCGVSTTLHFTSKERCDQMPKRVDSQATSRRPLLAPHRGRTARGSGSRPHTAAAWLGAPPTTLPNPQVSAFFDSSATSHRGGDRARAEHLANCSKCRLHRRAGEVWPHRGDDPRSSERELVSEGGLAYLRPGTPAAEADPERPRAWGRSRVCRPGACGPTLAGGDWADRFYENGRAASSPWRGCLSEKCKGLCVAAPRPQQRRPSPGPGGAVPAPRPTAGAPRARPGARGGRCCGGHSAALPTGAQLPGRVWAPH